MNKKRAFIPTMQGGRAVAQVMRTLDAIPHVEHQGADPGSRCIEIRWSDPATWTQIEEQLARAGFAPGDAIRDPRGQEPQPGYQSPSSG